MRTAVAVFTSRVRPVFSSKHSHCALSRVFHARSQDSKPLAHRHFKSTAWSLKRPSSQKYSSKPTTHRTHTTTTMAPDPEPTSILHTTTPAGITTITINRPHVRNAVDPPTAQKLHAAFLAFDADATQKVAILTGSGGAFCAGADLHKVAAMGTSNTPGLAAPAPATDASTGHANRAPMGPSRVRLSKPLIAAIAGHAVAGGLELALLADVRVANAGAVLGVYCRRWGVPLIDGGTARLPAIVGLGRALDLVLTGRGVGADEALGMGLVNYVVPEGEDVLGKAMEIAGKLVEFPQACMRADREAVYYGVFGGEAGRLESAMKREWEEGTKVLATESFKGAGEFSRGAGRHGTFGKGGAKL